MKYLVLTLALLLSATAYAQSYGTGIPSVGGVGGYASGGSVPAAAASSIVSDNFARANSETWGSNWTHDIEGDWDILTEQGLSNIADFSTNVVRWTGSGGPDSVDMCCKFDAVDCGGDHTTTPSNCGCAFRGTGAFTSGDYYYVSVESQSDGGEKARWVRHNNATFQETVQSSEVAADDCGEGNVVVMCVHGTGTATEVQIYCNSTDPDSTWNEPDIASNWTADFSFTNNPATAVDTGTRIGVNHFNRNTTLLDDWVGGNREDFSP